MNHKQNLPSLCLIAKTSGSSRSHSKAKANHYLVIDVSTISVVFLNYFLLHKLFFKSLFISYNFLVLLVFLCFFFPSQPMVLFPWVPSISRNLLSCISFSSGHPTMFVSLIKFSHSLYPSHNSNWM